MIEETPEGIVFYVFSDEHGKGVPTQGQVPLVAAQIRGWSFWYQKYKAECLWGQSTIFSSSVFCFVSGYLLRCLFAQPHGDRLICFFFWALLAFAPAQILWLNHFRDFLKEETTYPQDRNKSEPLNYMGD